jgi:hypothetical protein
MSRRGRTSVAGLGKSIEQLQSPVLESPFTTSLPNSPALREAFSPNSPTFTGLVRSLFPPPLPHSQVLREGFFPPSPTFSCGRGVYVQRLCPRLTGQRLCPPWGDFVWATSISPQAGFLGAIPEPVDPVDVACAPAMRSILGYCTGKRTEGVQTTVVVPACALDSEGTGATVDCGQWKLANADAPAAAQASSQPPRGARAPFTGWRRGG